MKPIQVEVVLWEKGNDRIPLFIHYKGRKHKITNSHIYNKRLMYMEGKKAVVYNVQVAATRFKLYNDLVNGYPTTRWFVDGDCELFIYMGDAPF